MLPPTALVGALILSSVLFHRSVASPESNLACKCIPGDDCWPNSQEWANFNATIGGKLLIPHELAAACHNPNYDETTCNYVRKNWNEPWLHDASSSSVMAAAVTNLSCDPFTARELPCEPGDTVTYSVNASDASEIVKAMSFARDKNIRLVIRNTGHDYMGKSTGKWALSVWTHHMKSIEYLEYNSTFYTGPAIRLGAGIQVEEAYVAAHTHNYVIVGGDCDTVGVAGGYMQGGGHSALSTKYGMAVDQVLEWEVVDGMGRHLKASPSHNADLYWALSGGGGGTYGIVTSVVVKLLQDMPMMGVQLGFSLDHQHGGADAFHRAVSKYHELVPNITAAGGMGIGEVTSDTFLLTPLTLPNLSRVEAEELLAPLVKELNSQGLAYSLNITEHANWLDYWQKLIKPNPTQLVQNAQYGGWMVPRSVLKRDPGGLESAIREITDAGCVFVGLALNASNDDVLVQNSILPSWREAALNVILSTPWPEKADLHRMKTLARTMTETCVPALAKLAPEAGAYLNEADPNQPGWKRAFYGKNYERLLAIKNKYDPDHLFYGRTAVGSDFYFVDNETGRLCRSLNTTQS